jgi:MFS family permease
VIAPTRLRAETAYFAVSAGLVGFASLEFMLEAIREDFSLTPDQTIVVGQISGGACLLAVFLVGALADRLGARRVLEVATLIATLIVGLAPERQVLLVGLSVSSIGTIAMAIIGLSELNRMNPDPADRARAFGYFAVVAPVVSIIVPLLAAAMLSCGAFLVTATASAWVPVMVLAVAVGGVIAGALIFDELDADTALDLVAYQQQADAFHLAGALCLGAYAFAAVMVLVHARRRAIA